MMLGGVRRSDSYDKRRKVPQRPLLDGLDHQKERG
jgi:hypothetical protein